MNTEKVKRFVKEHKKEIIIGAVCAGVGVHYGRKKYVVSAEELKLVRSLRTFYPMKGNHVIKDIYDAQKSSTRSKVFRPECKKYMNDIGEAVNGYVDAFGSNPEVTGFVVFTK